jgi:hypothetical protein
VSEVITALFVAGRPRTKGSMAPFHVRGTAGRPCRISLRDSELSVDWKKTMIKALMRENGVRLARKRIGGKTLVERVDGGAAYAGPVEVHAYFRFAPDHTTTIDVGGWPVQHDIGDEDKLRRNLLDALTQSHVLADDALSVGGQTWKRWCCDGEEPGVLFVVAPTAWTAERVRLMEALALDVVNRADH